MALSIANNNSSLIAQNNLGRSNVALKRSAITDDRLKRCVLAKLNNLRWPDERAPDIADTPRRVTVTVNDLRRHARAKAD